jgi:hypothetical protein
VLLADVDAANALDSLSMDIEDKILQVDSLSDTLDLLRLDVTNPEEFSKLLHLLPLASENGSAALCRKAACILRCARAGPSLHSWPTKNADVSTKADCQGNLLPEPREEW